MKQTSLTVVCIVLALLFSGSAIAGSVQETFVISPPSERASILERMSQEEQKWFQIFQEGTFFVDGWKEITRELLASTPEHLRENQKRHLEQLGLKIGLEWCKSNDIRRIDTKKLQQWGRSLKKTAKKNPGQLPEIIVSIDRELNNILN